MPIESRKTWNEGSTVCIVAIAFVLGAILTFLACTCLGAGEGWRVNLAAAGLLFSLTLLVVVLRDGPPSIFNDVLVGLFIGVMGFTVFLFAPAGESATATATATGESATATGESATATGAATVAIVGMYLTYSRFYAKRFDDRNIEASKLFIEGIKLRTEEPEAANIAFKTARELTENQELKKECDSLLNPKNDDDAPSPESKNKV